MEVNTKERLLMEELNQHNKLTKQRIRGGNQQTLKQDRNWFRNEVLFLVR